MKHFFLLLIATLLLSSFKPKQLTWVAIGDSITYLNDHPDETGNRVSSGYLSRVVHKLPHITYVNKGYNGWTSGGIADNIDKLAIPKADVYTVFLGTNDWWSGRPVGTLQDYINGDGNSTLFGSYKIIIDKLKKLNPAAKIVLITPMQRADFVYLGDASNNAHGSYKEKNGQQLEQFATAIKQIATYEHLELVDLYHDPKLPVNRLVKFKRLKKPGTGIYTNYSFRQSIGIGFDPKTDAYPYPKEAIGFTYDGLHPSDAGNKVIAKRLIRIFSTILPQ